MKPYDVTGLTFDNVAYHSHAELAFPSYEIAYICILSYLGYLSQYTCLLPQITVQCRPKRKAPCGMDSGSVTADH